MHTTRLCSPYCAASRVRFLLLSHLHVTPYSAPRNPVSLSHISAAICLTHNVCIRCFHSVQPALTVPLLLFILSVVCSDMVCLPAMPVRRTRVNPRSSDGAVDDGASSTVCSRVLLQLYCVPKLKLLIRSTLFASPLCLAPSYDHHPD